MLRTVSVVLAVCLVSAGFAPIAVAQEESNTTATDTPSETATATPTPTPKPTSAPEEGDQSSDANVTAEDLWTVFKQSEKAKEPDENRIIRQLDPNLYVTDIEWSTRHNDIPDGSVEVTFRAAVTKRITVTDATGVFAGDNKGEKRSLTIPRGTSTVTFPATPSEEDSEYQAISVDPGNGYVYGLESKDDRDTGGSPLDSVLSLWWVYASVLVTGLGAIWYLRDWFSRLSVDGPPTTSDGVEIPEGAKYGDLKPVEGGDDDD